MRTVISSLAIMTVLLTASAGAQSPFSGAPTPAPAQQPPSPTLKLDGIQIPSTPEKRQFGIFTLDPPTTNGQIIGIGVPIGALVVQGITSLKDAQHRRTVRKVRAQVQRELEEFLQQNAVSTEIRNEELGIRN